MDCAYQLFHIFILLRVFKYNELRLNFNSFYETFKKVAYFFLFLYFMNPKGVHSDLMAQPKNIATKSKYGTSNTRIICYSH